MKYVLYIRKSSESEERQVMSLAAQETEMLSIAKRDQLNIVDIIKESHSAKQTGQRPEFNRMIKGIRDGTYTAILTWAPDRLSRNAGDLGMIVDLMDSGQLEFVQTNSQIFSNDPNSKFMLMMLGSQAKLENDQKSLNVKRGNREKLRRGDWINKAPFGYLNDKATKTIVVDHDRAPYVAEMFERYATGLYSYKQLANRLYEQGLRTHTGKKVYAGSIQRILNRTFYYGVMEVHGKYYSGKHQPLISQTLFDNCQQIAGNTRRPRAKTKGFTLSGFITCDKCGCAVTAEMKKGKYIYYHCTNGKGICDQKPFYTNENTLHVQIADKLETLKVNQRLIDIVYKAKLEALEQSGEYRNHALEAAETTLQALLSRKSRLVDTFTNGDIDEDLYQQKLQDIENNRVNLVKQIEEMKQNTADPLATIELTYSRFKQGYTMAESYREASPEEKRVKLSEVLSNSTLNNRNMAKIIFKSPYDILARTPENASFSQLLTVTVMNLWGQAPQHIM